jgi:SET domain-containing protein
MPENIDLRVEIIPNKGRGVVAKRKFKKGEVIEACPVLVLNKGDYSGNGLLSHYMFIWPGARQKAYSISWTKWTGSCLPLGFGLIYNHDPDPNADFKISVRRKELIFVAIRDINRGEEITHNYRWPKSWYRKMSWYRKGRERS